MKEKIENDICTFCGTKNPFSQDPIFALPAGRILHGRYLVGAVLGHGGFGITYVGMDMKTNQRIAIKEFMPDGLSTRVPGTTTVTVHSSKDDYLYGRNQFIEEARLIYKYNSNPGIISVNSLFEENNTAYYTMEYLDGCDLKQYLIQRGGTIPYDEAVKLLMPVFDALSEVHKQNVIHRDISPDNIYICRNGIVKLLDFGAARVALIGKSKSLSVILKRGYAPEEQYRSHGIQGPWTDIYALGATLYRCITGQLPAEATERLYRDELISPSRLCSGVPAYGEHALLKALSVKGENRYQTISDFKAALAGKREIYHDKQQVLTPKPPSQNISPAVDSTSVIGKRFCAFLIDGVIGYIILMALIRVIAIDITGYFMLMFMINFLYGSVFEASDIMATTGKKLMGLKVADAYGNKLDTGKVIIRNLVKYCPTLLVMFLPYYVGSIFGIINYASALFNSKNQALHDKAGSSYVIGRGIKVQRDYEKQKVKLVQSAEIQCISGYYKGSGFPINKKITLGRDSKTCNIIFPDDIRGVSRVHCELHFEEGADCVTIKDLHSTYGTRVGDKLLSEGETGILHNGDSFSIGENNKFIIYLG